MRAHRLQNLSGSPFPFWKFWWFVTHYSTERFHCRRIHDQLESVSFPGKHFSRCLMFWITVLFHDSHHLMVRHSAQAVAKKLERFRHIHTSYSSWSIAGRGDCSTCFLLSGSSPRLLSSRVRRGWWFKGYVRFVETRTNVGPFYSWGRFYQLASAHAYKRDGNCSSGKMLVRTIHGNGVIYHPNG